MMDTSVDEHLRLAEDMVNNSVQPLLHPSLESANRDYQRAMDYLAFAQKVENLRQEWEKLSLNERPASQKRIGNNIKSPSSSVLVSQNGVEPEFPVYFVSRSKLYKYGKRDKGGLYKKSVDIRDVESICERFADIYQGSPVTMGELESQFPEMPSYRLQVTVMALTHIGVLSAVGRGRYALKNDSRINPHEWLNELEKLPERRDLLER